MTVRDQPVQTASPELQRRLPIGAELLASGHTHFRVWAPRRRDVRLATAWAEGTVAHAIRHQLAKSEHGYFEGVVEAPAGTRYGFLLDDDPKIYPDPASRYQPDGPHGLSQVIDPHTFEWTDAAWGGVSLPGQVLYEMHVGTFTPEGTWAAAAAELAALAELGVTIIEMMPIAEFPGQFGWGYDGVDLFAPTHLYGVPDDLRRFVDRAHALGVGVILDVVYNHLGPDGAYLETFSDAYFSRIDNDWGRPPNFDGPASGPVREFFVTNAGYWIDEFHMDGLRLDATQSIPDRSRDHVIAEITGAVRQAGRRRHRSTLTIAENEPQHTRLMRPASQGGYGLDALWNDDYHHTAIVALTGRREAYYTDYRGTPQEFISCLKWGFLYQGQRYAWQKQPRGRPALDLPPASFVAFLENHDQIANTPRGLRTHVLSSPGRHRALTALTLLGPCTPMLFQGQEFAASAPFLYFADHEGDLGTAVRRGRARFLSQFPSYATAGVQAGLADPASPDTFARCILDLSERETHAEAYALHRDLLRLRRTDPTLQSQGAYGLDGAVLGTSAFALRFFGPIAGGAGAARPSYERDVAADRLLLINLGAELRLGEVPEPLVAPPEHHDWRVLWSTEDVRYGGCGIPPVETSDGWRLTGESAVLLAPVPAAPDWTHMLED